MKTIILICFCILYITGCGVERVPKNGIPTTDKTDPSQPEIGRDQGTINGGGGVGIRCDGKLELLDLHEARSSGLVLVNNLANKQQSVFFVAERMAKHFWNVDTIPHDKQSEILRKDIITPIFEGKPFMNYATDKMEEVKYVQKLPLSNDLGDYEIPDNCKLEQIAYFSDSKTSLSIVKSAWNELDWLSKSALVTHELIYLLDRRDGFENLITSNPTYTSEKTRKFVGQFMSTTPLPVKSEGVPSRDYLYVCGDETGDEGMSTYFYAFENPSSKRLSLVFNMVYGHSSFYQMRTDFKNIDFNQVTEISKDKFSETTKLVFSGSSVEYGFVVKLDRDYTEKLTFQVTYPMKDGTLEEGSIQNLNCNKF